MIKRIFMAFLAVFFPWLVFLIEDNPGGAVISLIMQASVIGWIPASVWAWRTASEARIAQEEALKRAREAEEKTEE